MLKMQTKVKATSRTAAQILFALASCTALGFLFLSPEDFDNSGSQRQLNIFHHELQHEEDKLCIAVVNDKNIRTASVVHESGHFELALPVDYEANVTVECTEYARMDPATEQSSTGDTPYTETIVVKQGSSGHDPSGDCSHVRINQLHLQPGYFDVRANQWIDHCTGPTRARPASEVVSFAEDNKPVLELPKDLCPITRKKKNVWVLFIGDSVARQWLYGLDMQLDDWHTGRNEKFPDHMQGTLLKDDENEIWLSYAFNFLWNNKQDVAEICWDLPITWGDYKRHRREGQREGGADPGYPDDKVPDIILFGPGYHATHLPSKDYGLALDDTLTKWKGRINEVKSEDAPMPQMHILLNIMPAPWLIPDRVADDRMFRTLLNDYRKNLAMIAVAHKHSHLENGKGPHVKRKDGKAMGEVIVKSVMDLFSIELPFNGEKGASPHKDAVHLGEDWGANHVVKAAGDRIIDTICYAGGNHEELLLQNQ